MPTLSVVIPHWPLDAETDAALARCVASFPPECERIVVVNDGTGYARNVNTGLRLTRSDYVAVANNDTELIAGDVYDLCVPRTVTSPLVIGERQGFGESIEPGGFHGCFWVAPRPLLDEIGLLDETLGRAYFEDDDLLRRLHDAGIETRQMPGVHIRHVGGLTTVKFPEHRDWLEASARSFEAKWGALPPPRKRYRRGPGETDWHFCQNCPAWPGGEYEEAEPPVEAECGECASLRSAGGCAFY
jgi:GT2 family glycosyltransferase